MEAIDILMIVNSLDDLLLVDVLRQRKLNDEAVHTGVLIQLLHFSQQRRLRDVVLETKKGALESTLLARAYLIINIRLRAAVVAHEDGCEVRALAPGGYDAFDLLLDFCLDGGCGGLTVD